MTTVALLGNPNTGKTTLFNELTDKYAYVGNWTGVTVEKKMGRIRHSEVEMVDLPGVYSLNPITKDEAVVTNYLLHNHPDLILNVTNASQLKRNLLLSIEVLEFGAPVIIALNMIDDLKRTGHYYDFDTLAEQLGCQIKATNARNKEGLNQLREDLLAGPHPAATPLKLNYPFMIEQAIRQASQQLIKKFDLTADFARWLTIQFINQNKPIRAYAKHMGLTPLTSQAAYYDAQKFDEQIFQTRLDFIEQTLASASQNLASSSHVEMTAKIDKWVTNPFLGLPVFVGIFYLMFKLSFDWVGTPLSDLLDSFGSGPLSTTVSHWLNHGWSHPGLALTDC